MDDIWMNSVLCSRLGAMLETLLWGWLYTKERVCVRVCVFLAGLKVTRFSRLCRSVCVPHTHTHTSTRTRTQTHMHTHTHTRTHTHTHTLTHKHGYTNTQPLCVCMSGAMGWLRLVGSIKLYVSFAVYRLFYRDLLQKRPMIFSILLTDATPYARDLDLRQTRVWLSCFRWNSDERVMSHMDAIWTNSSLFSRPCSRVNTRMIVMFQTRVMSHIWMTFGWIR